MTSTLSPRSQKTNTGHFANPNQGQIPPFPADSVQARADLSGHHAQANLPHPSLPPTSSHATVPYSQPTPIAAPCGSHGTAIAPYQSDNDSQTQFVPQPPAGMLTVTPTPKPAVAQEQTVTQSMSDAIRALQLKVEKLEGEK